MSVSLKRNTHFGGSRVPKQLPKPTKSIQKADQKSRLFLHGFLDWLCLHFRSILGPPGLPWRAKVPKKAPQSHPKRTKKAAKTGTQSQELPRTQNYLKISLNGVKMDPKNMFLFNHAWMVVGLIFPAFRIAFRIDFRIDSHPMWKLTGLWPLASGL